MLVTAKLGERAQKLEVGNVFAKRIGLDRGLTEG